MGGANSLKMSPKVSKEPSNRNRAFSIELIWFDCFPFSLIYSHFVILLWCLRSTSFKCKVGKKKMTHVEKKRKSEKVQKCHNAHLQPTNRRLRLIVFALHRFLRLKEIFLLLLLHHLLVFQSVIPISGDRSLRSEVPWLLLQYNVHDISHWMETLQFLSPFHPTSSSLRLCLLGIRDSSLFCHRTEAISCPTVLLCRRLVKRPRGIEDQYPIAFPFARRPSIKFSPHRRIRNNSFFINGIAA